MSPRPGFGRFNALPRDVRTAIWGLVEPPARLVGLVDCPSCGASAHRSYDAWSPLLLDRLYCQETVHPDWDTKCVVHPQSEAVFALLHACRESRAVWRHRFWQPPKYASSHDPTVGRVRFFVPFVSYETDTFTVFQDPSIDPHNARGAPDLFAGLDLARIRHVGVCDNFGQPWTSLLAVPFAHLTSLRSLSLICLGPGPLEEEPQDPKAWRQMTPSQMQRFNCHVRDITVPKRSLIFTNHVVFNRWRPTKIGLVLSDMESTSPTEPFDESFFVWMGMLWHILAPTASSAAILAAVERGHRRRDFFSHYALSWAFTDHDKEKGAVCPLPLPTCGPGGHTRAGMHHWEPPFEIRCRYLCEEQWLRILDSFDVFGVPTRERLAEFHDFMKNNYSAHLDTPGSRSP